MSPRVCVSQQISMATGPSIIRMCLDCRVQMRCASAQRRHSRTFGCSLPRRVPDVRLTDGGNGRSKTRSAAGNSLYVAGISAGTSTMSNGPARSFDIHHPFTLKLILLTANMRTRIECRRVQKGVNQEGRNDPVREEVCEQSTRPLFLRHQAHADPLHAS